MKKLTAPRVDRCIGCHSCSLACARLVHKLVSWDTLPDGVELRIGTTASVLVLTGQ